MIRCSLLLYLGMTFAAAIHAGPAENPTPGPDSSAPSKSPSEGFFKNDDLRLHYLDWGGTGHPIILLAALGETAHVFEDFAPAFTNSFRVLALTRRGFGKSDRAGNNYSLTDRVEDIRQLFHHLDLEKAHLIGHSIAGDEMTLFAIKHPELAGKLVYLDAASDRSKLAEVLDDTTPPPMRRLLSEALRLPDADQIKVPHLPKAEDWAGLVGVVRASTQFRPIPSSLKGASTKRCRSHGFPLSPPFQGGGHSCSCHWVRRGEGVKQ